jgi:hypothetical protein
MVFSLLSIDGQQAGRLTKFTFRLAPLAALPAHYPEHFTAETQRSQRFIFIGDTVSRLTR